MPIVNVRYNGKNVKNGSLWSLKKNLPEIVASALGTSTINVKPEGVAIEFDEANSMDSGKDLRILVLANVDSERLRNLDTRAWIIKMAIKELIGHDNSLVVYVRLAEGGVSISESDDAL
jgi:hypothetical protein